MPLSNFVRTPEELYYCSEPDKWHDTFGHIPFLMDKTYSQMYQDLGKLYADTVKTGNQRKMDEVDNLIWYPTEVGLIREGGELKAFGATLYSSSGELEKAFSQKQLQRKFTLENIMKLTPFDRSKLQNNYFIINSIEEISEATRQYREKYL